MKELIEALTIFSKYTDAAHPTACEHDVLHVNVEYKAVEDEDKARLKELGFMRSEYGTFFSFRYGSC